MQKRKALGKGLSALIPDEQGFEESERRFFMCPVALIEPNPYQPRVDFSGPELDRLVDSVKESGIVTPLLVSRYESGYRLIAGERRWRAAQKAGLDRVPVIIREASGREMLELALIENLHRKDLNPIEEALAYRRLLDEGGSTQENIAKRLGRDRSTIANSLRLLTLPGSIQQDVMEGRLTMGHARVIAGIKDDRARKELRDMIVRRGMSVRQAENAAKRLAAAGPGKAAKVQADAYYYSLSENLKRALGTKVEISKKKKGGRIVIHFYSEEELDRLLGILT
ncbi:MAG TPA: ParB/RepB/Spo0J family partition protein [Desulfobacteraceae bacterium]|jgi:ParB family transcriptional regulator, chromosome partitioning protein|nr:ParB/RepB/Spo0J family partition protein [Desulfobacteraceae bacterium]